MFWRQKHRAKKLELDIPFLDLPDTHFGNCTEQQLDDYYLTIVVDILSCTHFPETKTNFYVLEKIVIHIAGQNSATVYNEVFLIEKSEQITLRIGDGTAQPFLVPNVYINKFIY